MAGLLKPITARFTIGEISVESQFQSLLYAPKSFVVFQEPLLLNTSVYKNVALGLKFRHLTGREIERASMSHSNISVSVPWQSVRRKRFRGEAKRVSWHARLP